MRHTTVGRKLQSASFKLNQAVLLAQGMAAGDETLLKAPPEQEHEQKQHPPTSRICVKNLPKYVDDRRLKEHFAGQGEVTDAKVMRTRDGKSRCFGFVGFRSPDEAKAAVCYFNLSFMDTMRLDVEFAYKFGSSEMPRAWSKYTAGSSAHTKLAAPPKTGANDVPLGAAAGNDKKGKQKKKGREPLPEEADPKLKEFLQVMQPRNKQAIWTNDDLLPPGAVAANAAKQRRGAVEAAEDTSGSDNEYEELPGAAEATPSSSEGGGGSEEEEEQQDEDGVVQNAAVSDLDYLKSRVKASFDDDNEAFSAGGNAAAAAASDSDLEEEDGGSGSEKDEEDEVRESVLDAKGSEEDEVEEMAAAGAVQQKQQKQRAPAGKQPMARRRGADIADAELDVIFGNCGASAAQEDVDEEGAAMDSSEEEEEKAAVVSVDEEEDAEMEDAERQQAVGTAQDPAVVEAEAEASIADTGRLFVRNLPYTANEADLQQLFEAYGDLSEVHLVLDRASKKSKGFALVQFADPQDAVKAHSELDASIFMGRLIHILPGKRLPPPAEEDRAKRGATSSYKEKKEAELKAGAGNRSAWNTLFMRADTVAEAIAAHYGVSKAELLDRQAGDLAVRLALGETQVIAETKRALGEAGADVSKLEAAAAVGGKAAATRGVPRSDTVLLVKNLPFSSSLEELEALFGAIGAVGRLVLPPTRTLALVEFLEAQDARRAFKALAYKRYQLVPLYLEWAPKGIFSTPPPPRPAPGSAAAAAGAATGTAGSKGTGRAASGAAGGKAGGELLTGVAQAQADEVESSSIFVKNLAWATGEEALKQHFDAAVSAAGGAVRAVKVAKRKGPDGKMLSAGFGFVGCSSEAVAKAAVKALQGSALDGHKLVLQLSLKKGTAGDKRKQEGGNEGVAGQQPDTSKVVVRNVAFEATRKDIMGLFTSFGHIKSCRLPRKFDGTHRGFAFVDFATKQEARNAMEAVQGTHLYGRRLVLEWAEEEGGLDELRAKTAAKYRGEEALEGAAEPEQQQQQKSRQRK